VWSAADGMPAVAGAARRQRLGGGSGAGVPVRGEADGGRDHDVDGRVPRGLGGGGGVDEPRRSGTDQAGRSVRVVPRAGMVGRYGDGSEPDGARIPHVGREEWEGCKEVEQ
jgi:hypothetical protein